MAGPSIDTIKYFPNKKDADNRRFVSTSMEKKTPTDDAVSTLHGSGPNTKKTEDDRAEIDLPGFPTLNLFMA